MITISLCMIVKDEEETLGRCLESIKDIADEIIIVDTGSTDRTKEIASQYDAKVYDFPWCNDFSAARNFSFSKAVMEYIMWLDADDFLKKSDQIRLHELKSGLDPAVDLVMMLYDAGADGEGNVTLSYYRERLFKRNKNYTWLDPVHEYIQPSGYIIQSDIHITHGKMRPSAPGRNLQIYRKLLETGKNLSPRSQLYFGMELYNNQNFSEAVEEFELFLDEGEGWVEDNIKACYYVAKSYQQTHDPINQLQSLWRSFEYDTPRAEICCEVGYYFKDKLQYPLAIFWFTLATQVKKPVEGWGFIFHDYWDFIPYLELCACNYQTGNFVDSKRYYELAAELKPKDPAVLYNKQFFE